MNLDDPNLDPAIQQEFKTRQSARTQAAKAKREDAQQAEQNDAQIISMIETIGQLDLDERGGWDFRGTSSGAVFLGRMKDHFRGLLDYDTRTAFLPRPSKNESSQFTSMSTSSPDAYSHHVYDLPPKERAHQLCLSALTCATALLRIVHIPSFFDQFDDLFDKPQETFGVDDSRFLGLVYAVMAVGSMYSTAEEDDEHSVDYKQAIEEGSVIPRGRPKQSTPKMLTFTKVEILFLCKNLAPRHHGLSGLDNPPRAPVLDTISPVDLESEYLLRLPRHRIQGRSPDGPPQAFPPGKLHSPGNRAEEASVLLHPAARCLLLVSLPPVLVSFFLVAYNAWVVTAD